MGEKQKNGEKTYQVFHDSIVHQYDIGLMLVHRMGLMMPL